VRRSSAESWARRCWVSAGESPCAARAACTSLRAVIACMVFRSASRLAAVLSSARDGSLPACALAGGSAAPTRRSTARLRPIEARTPEPGMLMMSSRGGLFAASPVAPRLSTTFHAIYLASDPSGRTVSVLPQRHHGIHRRRAARRDQARQDGGSEQEKGRPEMPLYPRSSWQAVQSTRALV